MTMSMIIRIDGIKKNSDLTLFLFVLQFHNFGYSSVSSKNWTNTDLSPFTDN